jgi:cardiolipin synthase A/B
LKLRQALWLIELIALRPFVCALSLSPIALTACDSLPMVSTSAANVIANEPISNGNKIDLFQDGPATYEAMNKAIASARDNINMETYIIEDDDVGQAFVKLFIEKQRAGVQVNLIYDSVGSIKTPRSFFEPLTAAGVNVLEFNPVNPLLAKNGWELNQRDHRKLLIVDGKTVFLGGVNISAVYSGGSFAWRKSSKTKVEKTPWRDTDLQIDGPVAASFQQMFLSTWAKQKGVTLKNKLYFPELTPQGSQAVRAIGSSSDDAPKPGNDSQSASAKIYTALIAAINTAQSSICLTNAYFVPDRQLLEALKQAVLRGVNVKIILPGHTDSALVFHAGRSHYQKMLEDGVQIFERSDKLLHSKTVLIDDKWSSVGSSNLDWRSFIHNDEVSAIIVGEQFALKMRAMFEKDLTASTPVLLINWNARPLIQRVKERAARVWAYWL